MSQQTNRRSFIKSTAALGVGYWVAGGVNPRPSRAAIEEINFASIGIDGKGRSDSIDCSRNGNLVAICDIDEQRLDSAGSRFEKAKKYHDFRKMLEEMDKSIDAVTVSTPDHTHAVASVMAMHMGKHCFCQKPLTHSIFEARKMGQLATEKGLTTQMGNQGTAEYALRKSAALVQAGAIGTVKEVHVWTNRPVWPQGDPRPSQPDPVPSHVHWKQWLSRAPHRDYNEGLYHPFKWRGWWDFGTGALGDMACHTLNMPYMALNLRDPVSVQATTSGHNKDYYPKWSEIEFQFPAIGDRPAVKMMWYDGGKTPPRDLVPTSKQLRAFGSDDDKKKFTSDERWFRHYTKLTNSASLIVGEKGVLFSAGDYGGEKDYTCIRYGKEWVRQEDVTDPAVEVPPLKNHFTEFADAIKSGQQATSNFPDYSGPLTETILLGNLAVFAADTPGQGPKVDWDAKKMRVLSMDDAFAAIVRPPFHNGYSLSPMKKS